MKRELVQEVTKFENRFKEVTITEYKSTNERLDKVESDIKKLKHLLSPHSSFDS